MDKHYGFNSHPYYDRDPQSYIDLNNYLKKGKHRKNTIDRPIANNTRVIRRSPTSIAIRLHATDVITFFDNGSIQLNSDGWKTVTTKDRMTRFLPSGISIYSERFIWYVQFNQKKYLYEDGMYLAYDGYVTDANGNLIKQHSKEIEKTKRIQLRHIDEYIRNYLKALQQGKVKPDSGDCWICQAFNGQPIADKMFDAKVVNDQVVTTPFKDNPHCNCIQSHIDDKYYVGTLLLNAIKSEFYDPDPESPFGNPNMTYGLAPCDKHNLSLWMNPEYQKDHKFMAMDLTIRRMQKALKQFITKQLNF